MKRCKSCLTKAEAKRDICPVCGINQEKKKNSLTALEAKVRRSARGIRGVALFHLALSLIGTTLLLTAYIKGKTPSHFIVQMVILITYYSILMITAFGLSHYRYWAYKTTTIFYFLIGIMFTISVQIPGALMILVLLYLIGNGTAKAIFERHALS